MTTIIGGYTTEDARRAMERQARDGGYSLTEWLIPSEHHNDLRVVCVGKEPDGSDRSLGFRWDGEDINALATRCMALDMAMRAVPDTQRKAH